MPNRKITQFEAIAAAEINDADLLTLVSVFEVDPALRNKKLTFTEFRNYLDQYYINSLNFDPLIATNIIISSGLNVSGIVSFSDVLSVSGAATFTNDISISGDVVVGTDLAVDGTISGNVVDVGTIITDSIEVQGTGTFITATGGQSNFITGNFQQTYTDTATGQNSNYLNGNYSVLTADVATFGTLDISGITITGDFVSSGTITANDINATGTFSGNTITGNTINAHVLNTESGYFQYISGNTITGNTLEIYSGIFANVDSEQVESNQVRTSGLYVYNLTGLFTTIKSGFVQEDLSVTGTLSGASITGDVVNAVSAYVDTFTGAFISGYTVNAGRINVDVLNAVTLEFSGNQTISGDLSVLGVATVDSGIFVVAGASSFPDLFSTSGEFTNLSGTTATFDALTVTGNADVGDDLFVGSALTVTSGAFIDGSLTVTGETLFESGLSVTDNVYFGSGLVVSGNTTISGDLNVSGNVSFSGGDFTYNNLTVSGTALFNSGTAAAPSISYINDTSVGVFFTGSGTNSGNVSLAVSGTEKISLNNSGLITVSPGNVALGGSYEPVSGLYISGGVFISGEKGGAPHSIYGTTYLFSELNMLLSTGVAKFKSIVVHEPAYYTSGVFISGQTVAKYGSTAEPGLAFDRMDGSTSNPVDGIMVSKPSGGTNATMTFVHENTSGMSFTSGDNGFILTIWGN